MKPKYDGVYEYTLAKISKKEKLMKPNAGIQTRLQPTIDPHFTFSKLTGRCLLTNLGEAQQAYYINTRLALAAAFKTYYTFQQLVYNLYILHNSNNTTKLNPYKLICRPGLSTTSRLIESSQIQPPV